MRDVELKDLRMILMIVETGNLTRAAGRLHISQPALSRQLLDLEARLGADLFRRQARRMVLTDIGRDLLAVAEEIVEKIDQAEKSIAQQVKGNAGHLKIGVHCIFCFSWLPDVVKRFQASFPGVDIIINSSEDYVQDLSRGRCDLVITPYPIMDKTVEYDLLFADRIIPVMAPDHPLASRESLQIEDFGNTSYISFSHKDRDPFYSVMLRPAGIEPQLYMVVSQANALVHLVRAGLGIALVPGFSVADMVEKGELVSGRVHGVPLEWKWYMAHRKRQATEPFYSFFVHMIQETMSARADTRPARGAE